MKINKVGLAVAAAAAALFAAGCASNSAQDGSTAGKARMSKNGCSGKSSCSSKKSGCKGHASCKGKSSCSK